MNLLAEILARLEIAGATDVGGTADYAGYLPILDENGLIPVDMIPGYSAPSLTAADVEFDDAVSASLTGQTNVQDAIDTLAAGVLYSSNNLSDVVSLTAFSNIRQAASTTYAGVVELATNSEVEAGSDTPTTTGSVNGTATKLVPSVSSAVATFVKKTGGTMTGLLTLSGGPSSNLHAATKQYVDETIATEIAESGLTTIPMERLIFVSTGSSATDTRTTGDKYFSSKPFATLTAAKTAATSGDTIVVLPGTYAEKNLLKNGVNWFFYPGAFVQVAGSAAGAIFDDSTSYGTNGAVSCRILGHGRFDNTSSGAGTGGVFHLTKTGTNIQASCETVGEVGGSLQTIRIEAGTLNLQARSGYSGGGGFMTASGSSNSRIRVDTVGGYSGFTLSSGTHYLQVGKSTQAYSNFVLDGGTSLIAEVDECSTSQAAPVVLAGSTFSGSARLICKRMTGAIHVDVIQANGGKLRIDGAKIINSKSADQNNRVVTMSDTSGPNTAYVCLNNCDLLANGTYNITSSGGTAVNIYLGGYNRTDHAKAPAVTTKFGVLETITDGTLSYV